MAVREYVPLLDVEKSLEDDDASSGVGGLHHQKSGVQYAYHDDASDKQLPTSEVLPRKLDYDGNIPVPRDHFCFAVFVFLCCSPIFGAFAIVKSLKTRDKIKRGDLLHAREKSLDARRWATIGIIFGIMVAVSTVIIIAVVYVMANRTIEQLSQPPPDFSQQLSAP